MPGALWQVLSKPAGISTFLALPPNQYQTLVLPVCLVPLLLTLLPPLREQGTSESSQLS